MLEITIPGRETLRLEHLVLDYNGTIACDGVVKPGVMERLERLSEQLTVHVITADTYGSAHAQCAGAPLNLHVIGKTSQDREKEAFVQRLGVRGCVAVGNGRNDAMMLEKAALGFALLQEEGLAVASLVKADILYRSIEEALDALLIPGRLVATLRN